MQNCQKFPVCETQKSCKIPQLRLKKQRHNFIHTDGYCTLNTRFRLIANLISNTIVRIVIDFCEIMVILDINVRSIQKFLQDFLRKPRL